MSGKASGDVPSQKIISKCADVGPDEGSPIFLIIGSSLGRRSHPKIFLPLGGLISYSHFMLQALDVPNRIRKRTASSFVPTGKLGTENAGGEVVIIRIIRVRVEIIRNANVVGG
jgi:hypothetical protein